jgi:hypothetical protein
MWRLSEANEQQVHLLSELQQHRSWLGRGKSEDKLVFLLDQIGEQSEPAALPVVARSFFSSSAEVRIAACLAVDRLVRRVPAERLLDLGSVIGHSWGWHISNEWDRLTPSRVESLILDESARTSVLGLASFHHNGYVRHESVRLLADVHDGTELPFLLVRQNDWVAPISTNARSAVEVRLRDEYLPHFVRCLPLVLHLLVLGRCDHSEVVQRVVEMLVQPQHHAWLVGAINSESREVRRQTVKLALEFAGVQRRRVVLCGLESDDPVIRLWCARQISAELSGNELSESLNCVQTDPSMPVRTVGFVIEAEAFPDRSYEIWKKALLDRSASIRDLARFSLSRVSPFDAAEFYRKALVQDPESLEALSGLGETGNQADLQVVQNHLTHVLPSRRRAAIRGLGRMAGESACDLLANQLRDESPSVVREVVRQLRRLRCLTDGEQLLPAVLDDTREFVQDAALLLITDLGKWQSLPFLIRAAACGNQRIAARAEEFVEAWFTPPRCNRIFTRPTEAESRSIRAARKELNHSLSQIFSAKLARWIGDI